jgi:hypothetical protein
MMSLRPPRHVLRGSNEGREVLDHNLDGLSVKGDLQFELFSSELNTVDSA